MDRRVIAFDLDGARAVTKFPSVRGVDTIAERSWEQTVIAILAIVEMSEITRLAPA